MVYIRSKKIKDENYLYLVKSVWDKEKSTSKQELIKYLGNASGVTSNDIPLDYRNDPKILSFLSSKTGQGIKENEKLINKIRKELYNALSKGDFQEAFSIYKSYQATSDTTDFFENILTPVMYYVGDLWESNKISVATEHVCSNVAHGLVNIIMEKNSVPQTKPKVILCTPTGEEHNLGCKILESFLSCKGYKIINLSPSAPSESIFQSIENDKPKAVFVSITMKDNIGAGQRLVRKIKTKYALPVYVGGQAVKQVDSKFDTKILKDENLKQIEKILRADLK